jgi:hypothetical protein
VGEKEANNDNNNEEDQALADKPIYLVRYE